MPKNKELSSLIHRRYDSEAAFARDLGWTRQRLNKLTTGVKEPDISEAALMVEAGGFGGFPCVYFFNPNVTEWATYVTGKGAADGFFDKCCDWCSGNIMDRCCSRRNRFE